MLRVLHIENIAVIEQASITFQNGFHALTGETGAGKSIVIDAISAVLGERTYRDVIRTGADRAFVSAVFDAVPQYAWFAENGIEFDAQELSVQREIFADGRNVCRVNGRPVTVAVLRKLGMNLINIHGQHDSQQLFDEANHLHQLDLFAHDAALLARYQEAFAQMSAVKQELARLSMDESEKLRFVENLRYQIDEISNAQLYAGEDEELESVKKRLSNAEKLSDAIEQALAALYGGDTSDGAAGLLSEAAHAVSTVSRNDEQLRTLHQKLEELMYGAQDAAEELRDMRDGLTDSGAELERIEQRLDIIFRLKRKYGANCAEILSYLDDAQKRLEEIEFADERMEMLKKQLAEKEALAEKIAKELSEVRHKAAEELAVRMELELSQLDMPKIRFVCQFEACELCANGMDAVRFLMSANVGEALKPMNKVASGGELARIMLAMKNILAEHDDVPTLIFDEVDAGVSGRAAQKVAEKLAAVSRGKQVLCVTHLPQLAAMADTHFIVEKRVENARTYTHVIELDREGRRQELARITGGAAVSQTLLQGAEEMLAAAENYKKALQERESYGNL